jgi:hypothetical protein
MLELDRSPSLVADAKLDLANRTMKTTPTESSAQLRLALTMRVSSKLSGSLALLIILHVIEVCW